jgi:hypothetical protein
MKDETDPRFGPILTKTGDAIDPLKLGAIEQAHRTGEELTSEQEDARNAVLEHPMGALWLSRSALQYDAYLAEQVRIHGGEIVSETYRWGRRVERTVQRFPGAQVQPQLQGEARPGVRRSSQRSCARSGDSPGDDGPSDEPPSRRLCAFCGKDIPPERSPKATHCTDKHADRDRQRRKRARDRARSKLPAAPITADFRRMVQLHDAERERLWELAVCRCNGQHLELEPGSCAKCGHWLPHEIGDGAARYAAFMARLARGEAEA